MHPVNDIYEEVKEKFLEHFSLEECKSYEMGGKTGHLAIALGKVLEWCCPPEVIKDKAVQTMLEEHATAGIGAYHNYCGGGMKGRICVSSPAKTEIFPPNAKGKAVDYVMKVIDAFDQFIVEVYYDLEDEPDVTEDGETNWGHLTLEQRQQQPRSYF